MSSYGHRCRKTGFGNYMISWVVDYYYPDSRLRFPRGFSRVTDTEGAKKFCKKWDIKFDEPERTEK